MADISTIIDFASRNPSDIIADLKEKSVPVPAWDKLAGDYEPTKHKIVHDTTTLKDKTRADGTLEPSARIPIGLEQLLTKRMAEFTFSLPVKRVYSNVSGNDGKPNEVRQAIVKAIESVYKNVRIDSENLKRGLALYASCEVFTLWYAVKKPNTLYGFDSEFKLKCKTYSLMDGTKLYPLIDELDDMIAMSFEYSKTIGNQTTTYFETYTADRHYIWKQELTGGSWSEVTAKVSDDGETVNGEEIVLMKIPGAYAWIPKPVYHGLTGLRSEIEYTLSRNSNVIAYNSAPILKIVGGLKGKEDKGESRRIFRVENGGDVGYVAWQQAIEALKYHVDTMLKLYWMQAQIPDISFENMKNLGNIGFDARQTMLTDAHLKIGEMSGIWAEFLEREFNVLNENTRTAEAVKGRYLEVLAYEMRGALGEDHVDELSGLVDEKAEEADGVQDALRDLENAGRRKDRADTSLEDELAGFDGELNFEEPTETTTTETETETHDENETLDGGAGLDGFADRESCER